LEFIGWGVGRIYSGTTGEGLSWLTPWWGICMIVLFSGVMSLANIPMKYASYAILGLALATNLWVGIVKKEFKWKQIKIDWWLVFLVVALTAFYLYPMWGKVGYQTTLSLGNLDPVTYANGGEFLREHSVIQGSSIDIQHPFTWSIVDILHYGYRYGVPLLLAFLATILKQDIYQIFTIFLALITALTVPLLYSLGKRLMGNYARWLLVGSVLFFGLNSTLMYWQFHGFLPQFVYGGLIILTILVALGKEPGKIWWLGVCLATITSVYPDGVIIALVPLLMARVKGIGKAILLAFALSPVTVANSWAQIVRLVRVTTNTTFIGWERIRIGSWWEVLGLYNLNYSRDLPGIIDWVIGLPIMILGIWGWWRSRYRRLTGAYLIVVGGFLLLYRVIIDNFFVYQRVTGYGLFLLAILVSLGFAQIKNQKISLGLMVLMGALTLRSATRTMTQYYNHYRLVGRETAELKNFPIQKSPIYNMDVLTEGYDLWDRVWEEHFLRGVPFYTRANFPQTGRGDGPFVILRNMNEKGYELSTVEQLIPAKDLL